MPHIPKKLRRELTANEQMYRYFKQLEREVMDKGIILGVRKRHKDGTLENLMITRIINIGHGFHIEVR